MRVIGTAGHVDHGKSTLVRRLTGIEPDRLAEEQQRELTIDLGFAWFDLPDGETVGIVDVPGHRDFIENMLAGVGGIDAALLVIAADEGVMPQTREHLAILDLLEVQNALVVLTKCDLVQDDEWLDLVELDVQETLVATSLADAPFVRVSGKTGVGIDDLQTSLAQLLNDLPSRTDYNQPRLPIDRTFTVEGFGTVVTGTLSGGTLMVGDTIEIQPNRVQGRVRGLQSYQQSVEIALPGSRVAVNISGVDVADISRGDVLAYPGQLAPTQLVDVQVRYLRDAERLLKHNAEVKLFAGASDVMARVRVLGAEALLPGERGWLQLHLRDPLPLTQRDRFILRYPSPPQTIGGGVVVDPHPAGRHKRFDERVIAALETRLRGSPAERVALAAQTPADIATLQKATALDDTTLHTAINEAIDTGQLLRLSDDTLLAASAYQQQRDSVHALLQHYHDEHPLRRGMPREALRRQQSLPNAVLTRLIADAFIAADGDTVRLPDHAIRFSDAQQTKIATLIQQMQDNTTPPSLTDAADIVGDAVVYALIERGNLVQVADDVIFHPATYAHMRETVLTLIDAHGATDAKQVRDALSSSRKYAIALLEHLDSLGVTKRVGDERQRGVNA